MSDQVDPAEKLVRMANQIAAFFRSYPQEEAAAGVHDHIVAFWSPSMRRDLLARSDHPGLDPLAATALRTLTTRPSPARKEAASPAELGEIGASDTG